MSSLIGGGGFRGVEVPPAITPTRDEILERLAASGRTPENGFRLLEKTVMNGLTDENHDNELVTPQAA